ncbi:hypothetical protein [Thalassovita taeanensis]|uniref:Uncharacterized protein n=1 Tax=Thalassovita taeanensis TaxID=657014 RepID=A0A1H9EHC8_9RHOB|nr:hypothetical protein [Thalassovita taeanensis]SEQ24663.1 hypothetical protein SAMN04488092_10538 [Thalassovita taeanensis]
MRAIREISGTGTAKGRNRWHIQRQERVVIVARRPGLRFDLSADAILPLCGKLRLAQQVRQDMWRLLRDLRGFSPMVRVEQADDVLHVRAGGQIDGRFPRAATQARLAALLADPAHRDRWVRYAGGGARYV